MPETKETNRKYVLFSHTFADMWAGDSADDAPEVTLSYRFAKPTKTQIQRLQDKAARNAGQASRNLVLDCVHPDGQGDALILHWLHLQPSEDLEEWARQVGLAVWMERRFFEALSRNFWGTRKV